MLDAQCSTCGAWHAVLEESVLCRRICHCAWHNVDTGFRGALAKWQEFFLGSATLPQPLMPCKEAPGILDVGLAAILKPILCKVLVIYLAIASCVFETNTAQCVSLP
eukprot:scaffold131930_cov22-Tisochrysis_lutea.AAC.1